MSKSTERKVLLVDDNQEDITMLKEFLVSRGYKILEASNGEQALESIKSNRPNIVILDWVFPGIQGVDVCREVKTNYPDVCVIMLTVCKDTDYKVKAFEAGCDDYLVKPCELEELEIRMENILRRGPEQNSQVLCHNDVQLDRTAHRVTKNGQVIDLTVKEYTLLEYLMGNTNKVITRNMILEHVWGEDTETFTNIVDVYVNYLRKKLDTPLKPSHIKTIRGAGYMMEDKSSNKINLPKAA